MGLCILHTMYNYPDPVAPESCLHRFSLGLSDDLGTCLTEAHLTGVPSRAFTVAVSTKWGLASAS